MIGYEFELLVREGNRPLQKETFERFHAGLVKDGWHPKLDPMLGGTVGSYREDWFVGCDDGVCIMESNMPPRDTIGETDAQMRDWLAEAQGRWKSLGCTLTGVGSFPGDYDIAQHVCHDRCIDPQCSYKNYIAYQNAHRFPQGHHALFAFAGNHVWLDSPVEEAFRRWHVLTRLNPLLMALTANAPLFNRQRLPGFDGRDHLWETMLGNGIVGDDMRYYGMPRTEPASLLEYLDLCMTMPFYFELRDGKSFRLLDEGLTYHDYYTNGGAEAAYPFESASFHAQPTVADFENLQGRVFFSTRIKYRVREDASIGDVLDAYHARDEARLLGLFDRICLEVRTVGAQPEDDLSAAPALLLGLMERLEAVEELVESEPYVFWKDLTADVQLNGMHPVRDGLRTVELLDRLLAIATEGLQARGEKEERFLEPLRARLDRRETPAEEQIKLWEQGGLEALWAARDYR